jgi:hypothetical protein
MVMSTAAIAVRIYGSRKIDFTFILFRSELGTRPMRTKQVPTLALQQASVVLYLVRRSHPPKRGGDRVVDRLDIECTQHMGRCSARALRTKMLQSSAYRKNFRPRLANLHHFVRDFHDHHFDFAGDKRPLGPRFRC